MSLISFDVEKCTACGICSMICPVNIIMPGEKGAPSLPTEYEAFCTRCGHCEAVCPANAIMANYQSFPPEDDNASIEQINPEQLKKYIQSRRSIRIFKNKPVEKEKIRDIFEAVRFAPSGMNGQPVKWLVVTDASEIKKFADLTIDWMRMMAEKGADHPLKRYFPILVALADAGFDPICRNSPGLVYAYSENASGYTDSIIALTTFDLIAPSFGLGTCWVGLLHRAAVEYQPLKEALGIPAGFVLQFPMLFGYPKYKHRKIPGRKKADIIWR
ncbi:4Fe-4S dicluster domain-containing protein [Methanosarcina sp. DH1]|uniref:nitroreductase family protein n=1 Tax=Methanosarcina sp. DH1 TaxID=2605695 RepID=UPI001E35B677|nr:nitroreductase family protein [Methanosarcina sp. DH1]MCC4766662.1 4Fe-4S dicluster domain-containing protein [Methanosarcina sp. DH1]